MVAIEKSGVVSAPTVRREVGGLHLFAVEPCGCVCYLRSEVVQLEVELNIAGVQRVNLVERDDRLLRVLENHGIEEERVVGEHLALFERGRCELVVRRVCCRDVV